MRDFKIRSQLLNMPPYATHSGQQLDKLRGLEATHEAEEFHGNSLLDSGVLTHTLIFHSHVSLVYGSTCSLLVLSYYKCLLRLNSDIAKASVPTVLECP